MREEKIAEFLSTLRHVLRSIQELKHFTQEGVGNIHDAEVLKIINLEWESISGEKHELITFIAYLF